MCACLGREQPVLKGRRKLEKLFGLTSCQVKPHHTCHSDCRRVTWDLPPWYLRRFPEHQVHRTSILAFGKSDVGRPRTRQRAQPLLPAASRFALARGAEAGPEAAGEQLPGSSRAQEPALAAGAGRGRPGSGDEREFSSLLPQSLALWRRGSCSGRGTKRGERGDGGRWGTDLQGAEKHR